MNSFRPLFGAGALALALSFFASAAPAAGAEPAAGAAPPEGAPKKADPAQVVVATVDGAAITLADLDRFIERLPPQMKRVAMSRKADVLPNLIRRRLMYRHAQAIGLAKNKRVQGRLDQARRDIMIMEAVRAVQEKAKPTAAEVRSEFDGNKERYQIGEKVTASHIMVATEKKAKALTAELKKGADFAALAKRTSLAPERANGGSLGEMEKGRFRMTGLPEIIEKTAFSLKPGTFSGVVRSRYGWHVVHTESKTAGAQIAFEQARAQIAERLGKERSEGAIRKLLGDLDQKYPVQAFPERVR